MVTSPTLNGDLAWVNSKVTIHLLDINGEARVILVVASMFELATVLSCHPQIFHQLEMWETR